MSQKLSFVEGLIHRALSEGDILNNNTLTAPVEDTDYIGDFLDKNKHNEHLWLLIVDLLIFLALTFTSYTSFKKLASRVNAQPATSAAEDFKPKFIKGLLYANAIRALSLVIIIVLENRSGNDPASWLNYFCHVVPSFVFVSAYMYLVTFLADLYYSNIEYNNHLAKPALLLIVVSAYIILALMALITFAAQSFKAFAYASEFLMGIVYMILGAMIIYYGEKISELFSQKFNRSVEASNDIGKKLRILSLSIGGIFLLKCLSGLLTALHVFGDFYPVSLGANLWDFLWFLITEIAPTILFIFIARKKEGSPTPTGNDSKEDIEMRETYDENDDNFRYTPPKQMTRR